MVSYDCAARELCKHPELEIENHKCLECRNNVHAMCAVQMTEQKDDAPFIFRDHHLSQEGRLRLKTLDISPEALLCLICAKVIRDRVYEEEQNRFPKYSVGSLVCMDYVEPIFGTKTQMQGTVTGSQWYFRRSSAEHLSMYSAIDFGLES
mmetsp:Transcript_31019/g.53012  ORF Transcript_31019/g.53012 Transcript_31019/m.53012 type:complete len:150 (-) Transcript_31019:109-558(-)